jgi:antitoxin ParD1/3/4
VSATEASERLSDLYALVGELSKRCQTWYTPYMPTMNVSLTDDLSEFVAEQLREGYNNQSEVVRDGLRLLPTRNDILRHLRAAVDAGIADVEAGRTKPLTDELLRAIAQRGRRVSKARQSGRT